MQTMAESALLPLLGHSGMPLCSRESCCLWSPGSSSDEVQGCRKSRLPYHSAGCCWPCRPSALIGVCSSADGLRCFLSHWGGVSSSGSSGVFGEGSRFDFWRRGLFSRSEGSVVVVCGGVTGVVITLARRGAFGGQRARQARSEGLGFMLEMAEPAPYRWGAMSVLMRIRTKITKIREKLWMSEIWNDIDSLDSNAFPDSQRFENEATTSNHPDFQQPYVDAPQVFQDPTPPGPPQYTTLGHNGDLYSQMMQDSLEGSGTSHGQGDLFTDADFGEENEQQPWTTHQMDYGGLSYSTSQPIYPQYGCDEEFLDARSELQDEQCHTAPAQLGHHLSTVEKVEMMDTGDSSSGSQMRQSSPAEWQKIMFLQQFLEIDGVVQAGPGWRVVLVIVSAFKRLSGLIRLRRQQRTTTQIQTALNTPRRIRSGEMRYKGIRQRNGKWVSEIRIGGTLEKVWLGSFNTDKEAALAFDAGKHHCSLKRGKGFNFSDSPRLLGAPQNLSHLSSVERRAVIQKLAEDHARAYGSADIR